MLKLNFDPFNKVAINCFIPQKDTKWIMLLIQNHESIFVSLSCEEQIPKTSRPVAKSSNSFKQYLK